MASAVAVAVFDDWSVAVAIKWLFPAVRVVAAFHMVLAVGKIGDDDTDTDVPLRVNAIDVKLPGLAPF